MQKNEAFIRSFSHKYLILVRSTGIEDIRRYEKSLDFQGFFTIERQCGRQKILIFQTANGNNEDTVFTLIGIRRGGDNH